MRRFLVGVRAFLDRAILLMVGFTAVLASAQALSRGIRSGGLSPERFPGSGTSSAASDTSLLRLLPSISVSDECAGAAIFGTRGEPLSLTRSSSAYCTKSDGTLVLRTDDQPRLVLAGVMREGASTNQVIRSQELENAFWTSLNTVTITANYAAAPDGTTTADRVQLGSGAATARYQAVAGVYESQTHTVSCYVRATAGAQTFRLLLTHGGVTNYFSPEKTATATWQRFIFTQAFGATVGTSALVGVHNDVAQTAADLVVWGCQLEKNQSHASSYITTLGTTTARVGETTTMPTPAAISRTEGCTRVTYTAGFDGFIAGTDYILWLAATDGFRVPYLQSTSVSTYDGVHVVGTTKTIVANETFDILTTWTAIGNQLRVKPGGVTAATSAFTTMGAAGASMQLLNISGSGAWPAYLRNVIIGAAPTDCGVDP
jgi:hypothetical protein